MIILLFSFNAVLSLCVISDVRMDGYIQYTAANFNPNPNPNSNHNHNRTICKMALTRTSDPNRRISGECPTPCEMGGKIVLEELFGEIWGECPDISMGLPCYLTRGSQVHWYPGVQSLTDCYVLVWFTNMVICQ